MRHFGIKLALACVVMAAAGPTLTLLEETGSRSIMVAWTTEPRPFPIEIQYLQGVLLKADRLPIAGRQVKTETLLFPVKVWSLEEFQRRRDNESRGKIPPDKFDFNDRWGP